MYFGKACPLSLRESGRAYVGRAEKSKIWGVGNTKKLVQRGLSKEVRAYSPQVYGEYALTNEAALEKNRNSVRVTTWRTLSCETLLMYQ